MDIREILSHCDHTLLAQTATWDEIKTVLDDGIKYGVASCCIPPSFVKRAKEYVGDKMKICTVIGFPNGYNTADVKLFETEQAIKEGADEIDMVVNIGDVKEGKFKKVTDEIKLLKNACGKKILKVIIETCLLTDAEKTAMCRAVTDAGADYIKTSTGFSKAGATFDDVELFGKHVGKNVRIKAAGGISSLEDAEKFLALGADRLGTSRIVKLAKEKENQKR
ncbi:MAG: deoxyribose-phosphate aldolase [Eubacteriales bacterium]|nr:deoxyribose-phosphate aldolase [Christensenellaceae bacterium]MDD7245728.1 deoxyribose-phosphate aldolase [Christensenellaceae bacterium]MDY2751727.1 deoxyribose-phosphate aldolase [Eubacteriales bacterium]MDY3242033.1 deoxyribose-phosphate aldolase [Eubacteriales bacterium]MDY4709288.1 deoxyribose-phosphate aldolase [Eubacteriales bacterium]